MVRRYFHRVETGVRFSAGPLKNDVAKSGFDSVSQAKHGSTEKAGSGCVFKVLPDAGHERQGSGLAFHDFLQYAEHISNTVSKNKLEQLRTIVTKAHERRFRRRKEPRYGSINKGFTEPELQRFLRSIANDKFSLLFKY